MSGSVTCKYILRINAGKENRWRIGWMRGFVTCIVVKVADAGKRKTGKKRLMSGSITCKCHIRIKAGNECRI